MNRCRKKVIPWHVQKRYMESLSQLSLNQTISTAIYKKKIKSLQRNNRHLALSLQQSRYHATDKENLLIDNGKILDIINFSRVKLMDVAMNMKQATKCLDETLLLLNSSLTESFSKHPPCNLNYRNDFKSKIQEISRNSPIKEVSENFEGQNKNVQSYAQKGKISRVDGCNSSPNKKCKLAKKGRTVKAHCKDLPKSAEESQPATPITGSKSISVKNSKCSSALNVTSQNRKKSLPKGSNIKSASTSKLSTSSNRFLQAKTKPESLNKNSNTMNVILADIAEAFLTQETGNHHSPVKNEPTSASHSSNFNCYTSASPEDDALIRKYFSSELTCKQKSSTSNTYSSQFSTIDDAGIPYENTSDSSNFSHENLFCDIPEIDEKSPVLSTVQKDILCDQNSAVVKMNLLEENDNIAKQNNGLCIKKGDFEKDKCSYKSKVTNRVHFYYDEDSIEKVEGYTVASKDRIRKPVNKCKARKTVSRKKKNISSKTTALKSNLILPDNVSKLGKNSFLVTAEVHPPPSDIYAQEIKSKMCIADKMEPHVVLTDIFKSNRSLLSEMVGNGPHENECLQKTITKAAVGPLAEKNTTYAVNKTTYCNMNDWNGANIDCENAENRCLPEDREIIEQGKQRRRNKIVSYKEPSLNVKMRRLF